jgi:hypothetical protein
VDVVMEHSAPVTHSDCPGELRVGCAERLTATMSGRAWPNELNRQTALAQRSAAYRV